MPILRRAQTIPTPRGRRIALNVILGTAAVDGVFLVALVAALAVGSDGAVQVVGPLFGFGYIYLLYLTATGATHGRWGWWYTGLVAVTLGPIGAVLGALRLRAETAAEVAATPAPTAPRPTRKEQRKAATEQRRASGDR
jgi:hypothetical protein